MQNIIYPDKDDGERPHYPPTCSATWGGGYPPLKKKKRGGVGATPLPLLPPHHPSPPPRFRYCRPASLPLNTPGVLSLFMPNISHFMIPADDVDRARRFYSALLGWKIEPVKPSPDSMGIAEMQYHDITTGPAAAGMLNTGGLYKRHLNEPILDFVQVEDIDAVVLKAEKLGGKITMSITAIPGVGLTAMILDTEGNLIGLWKPENQ